MNIRQQYVLVKSYFDTILKEKFMVLAICFEVSLTFSSSSPIKADAILIWGASGAQNFHGPWLYTHYHPLGSTSALRIERNDNLRFLWDPFTGANRL